MQQIYHYTVNTNGWDTPRTDNVFCITESKHTSSIPELVSRHPKIEYYRYFDVKDGDIVIYNDANIYPKLTAEQMVERYLGNADIAIFRHPYRQKLIDEFAELMRKYQNDIRRISNSRIITESLREQFIDYGRSKYGIILSETFWENNFIIRRHSERMRLCMQTWFGELVKYTHRDQPSLPYVLKQFPDLKINTITEGNIREHYNFIYNDHLKH